jgi:hypothetical protein
MVVVGCLPYGRFLIARSNTTPTRAIAMIMAITPPMMYVSVGGKTISWYADGVGAASPTAR